MTALAERITPSAVLLSDATSPDDPRWHEARSLGVGSSEIAALLGIDPWSTPLSLWLAKTGRVPGKETSEPMKWGQLLEGPIAEEYAARNAVRALPSPGVLQNVDVPFALCNPDRMLAAPDDPRPFSFVECKNVSAWKADGWDSDAGQMPVHYLAQVVWQLGVTGFDEAAVACLVGGQHFESLTVHANPTLFASMLDKAEQFWDLVLSDTEPAYDHQLLTAEALRAVPVDPGKVIELDPDLAVDLRARLLLARAERTTANAGQKRADEAVKVIEGEVRALMLEAEVAFVNGEEFLRLPLTERKGYAVQPTSWRSVKIV